MSIATLVPSKPSMPRYEFVVAVRVEALLSTGDEGS
jgi:hypothetical protein